MYRTITLGAAMVLALAATAASADKGGKGKGKHFERGHGASFCPPGLAKKGCVPPGHAKKHIRRDDDDDRDVRIYRDRRYDDDDDDRDVRIYRDHRYYDDDDNDIVIRLGDRIDDRYVYIDDPWRYGLDPDWRYYRYNDRVVRVDPDTMQIVALLGLLDALLN